MEVDRRDPHRDVRAPARASLSATPTSYLSRARGNGRHAADRRGASAAWRRSAGVRAVHGLGVQPATRTSPRTTTPTAAEPEAPARTLNAPCGGCAPGGNRASTEPPKPPPMMRAPSAPALLAGLDGALHLGHRHLVVVAQARVRGVEQRARPRRGRPPRAPPRRRPRARSRSARGARGGRAASGRPRVARVASRSEADAERPAGRPALRAALVVAGVGRGSREAPESSVASTWPRELERHRAQLAGRACRCARRWPALAAERGELVEQAGLRRRTSRSRSASRGARARAGAAARRRPPRRGRGRARPTARPRRRARRRAARRRAISSRQGRSSMPSRSSSAAAPRTKRRQPGAPAARAGRVDRGVEREAVALAEVERVRLDRGAAERARPRTVDAALDRERQAEPVVVVGVLADQVTRPGANAWTPPAARQRCVLDGWPSGAFSSLDPRVRG